MRTSLWTTHAATKNLATTRPDPFLIFYVNFVNLSPLSIKESFLNCFHDGVLARAHSQQGDETMPWHRGVSCDSVPNLFALSTVPCHLVDFTSCVAINDVVRSRARGKGNEQVPQEDRFA